MFFPLTAEWQLFDLVADPDEMRSVHADPDYSEVLTQMRRRYEALREQYAAPDEAFRATAASN